MTHALHVILTRSPKTIWSYHHSSTDKKEVNDSDGGEDFESSVITCENLVNERMQKTNKAALYFLIVSTIVGFLLLLETHRGRSAMSYLPNLLMSGRWNERTVRLLLRHQREWAFQLGRNHVREQQQQQQSGRIMMDSSSSLREVMRYPQEGVGIDAEEEELELWECYKKHRTQKLTSLVFSTTTYYLTPASSAPPSSDYNDDDEVDKDEVECSICLVPLESGDRIGKLPCKHPMHVECLKSWLQRQNACPLCKRLKIAQPRYDDKNNKSKMGTTDELSNTRSTEGSYSADDLIRDSQSEEGGDAVQGPETFDPVVLAEDEQSNQRRGDTILLSGNSQEVPLQPDQASDHEEDFGRETSP